MCVWILCQEEHIFTVFPDNGDLPKDCHTLKEAIDWGNQYYKEGFIIQSPTDDCNLHIVNGKEVEE